MIKTGHHLKPVRGKTLPLSVDRNWSPEQLFSAAKKKIMDFYQDMEDGEYALLYPDGTVVQNLPGTETQFTIEGYKEATGKAYQRLTLYICPLGSFLSKGK